MPHRIPALRRTLLLLFALAATPAMAEPPAMTLYSEAETEWFRDSGPVPVVPVEGLRLIHRHGGEVVAGGDAIALRGSFGVTQTFALSGPAEESLSFDGALAIESAVAPSTIARAALSVAFTDESGALVVLGLPVGTRGATLELDGEIGIVHRSGGTVLSIDAGVGAVRPMPTTFSGVALLPQRLEAELDRQYVALGVEQAITPALAVVALAEASRFDIAARDTFTFGRLGAERVRAGAGLRLAPATGVLIEAVGGADLLTGALLGDALVRPYGYLLVEMALREGVRLTLAGESGSRFLDPADGFADWRWRLDGEGAWQIDPRWTLLIGGFAEGGTGVVVPLDLPLELGLEAGLRYEIAAGLTLTATAGVRRETLAGTSRDALTLGFGMRATL